MSTTQVRTVVSEKVNTDIRHGDWRDELFENGYVVVKGVIEPKKAEYYVNRMYSWLEKFQLGFNRNDKSTWKFENLPYHWKYVSYPMTPTYQKTRKANLVFFRGGMYNDFCVMHEDFVWEARTYVQ